MTSSAYNTSRRNLVKGAAWAAPTVLATAAVPAYAASTPNKCAASAFGTGSVWYDWGEWTGNRSDRTLTNQNFFVWGTVEATIPNNAKIVDIGYEVWVEQRNDSVNPAGPGIYDPGHPTSALKDTCKISYSNITSCSYKYGSRAVQQVTYDGNSTGPIFTSPAATVTVTDAWTDHAFTLLDGSKATSKAFRIYFQADVNLANSMLVPSGKDCLSLPRQYGSKFVIDYRGVRKAHNDYRTVRMDRTAIVKYQTPDGQIHTLTRRMDNKTICNSTGGPGGGGTNRC